MEKGDGHRFSLLDKKPVHAILLIFKQVKHQYNLHYFIYHYHHYMTIISANFGKYAISDCPFITCQNLHFGKYVRWSCLLLAKITILVSMLVGHVCLSVCYYLPKLPFGKYVRWSCLSVCLFVCLFVCMEISQNLKNESANHHQIWSEANTSPWFLQIRWTRI